jgi:Calpain family cysteine protease
MGNCQSQTSTESAAGAPEAPAPAPVKHHSNPVPVVSKPALVKPPPHECAPPGTNKSNEIIPHPAQKAKPVVRNSGNTLKKAKGGVGTDNVRTSNLRSTPQAKALYAQEGARDESIDPRKWKFSEMKFDGSARYEELGEQEKVSGQPIEVGIQAFRANPSKYLAFMHQSSMVDWPVEHQSYTFLHRKGTTNYIPDNVAPSGWMTLLLQEYQHLQPLRDLPGPARDPYTDTTLAVYAGRRCGAPILPGRGMGVGDSPNLKLVGDVDPSDIAQGTVGDCWLLSGISSLAEFDGAVKRLFRKTRDLDRMPLDRGPNQYTVTLWDLPTWTEVDIVVDERLCTIDGRCLMASKPSEDGELWVCYLEKALAAHCGGWDKISGGQCTHAWALLTGCKEQYTIRKNKDTGMYACHAKFDPTVRRWAPHGNSPHDGDTRIWNVDWPTVGGGGSGDIDQEALFQKMCAWDDTNFIVAASTSGTSDRHSTGGVVDNHAYSVIECINDVAGTDVELIKVRNPWGKGEIEDGEFDDDGPGWDRYPQIKKALNPVVADDGIFWVTKKEFFQFFQTVYLSASDMTEFLED